MTTGEQIISLDVDSQETVSFLKPKTLTFLILRFLNNNVLLELIDEGWV